MNNMVQVNVFISKEANAVIKEIQNKYNKTSKSEGIEKIAEIVKDVEKITINEND